MTHVTFIAQATVSRQTQIQSFTHLPDGWHFGEGRGATESAVAVALKIEHLLWIGNAHEVEAFPGVDGGILLSGYHGAHALEIRCDPSGRIDLLHEIDDGIVDERHDIPLEEVGEYVEGLEWKPKNSFAYCIPSTSADTGDDSQVRLSSHPQTAVSHYSILSVLLKIAGENARISIGTTGELLETLPFSGGSIPISSPRAVGYPMSSLQREIPATGTFEDWHVARAGHWYGNSESRIWKSAMATSTDP